MLQKVPGIIPSWFCRGTHSVPGDGGAVPRNLGGKFDPRLLYSARFCYTERQQFLIKEGGGGGLKLFFKNLLSDKNPVSQGIHSVIQQIYLLVTKLCSRHREYSSLHYGE